MIVRSARDVGIGATVRVGHMSGQVFEDKVIAAVGEKLILERGETVDPRKQYVKVVGFGPHWRAVEPSERDKQIKDLAEPEAPRNGMIHHG